MHSGLSIILVVRNSALALEAFLDSVLCHNTHLPVEFIVMDRASSDNTPNVLARFADKTCIRHMIRTEHPCPVELLNQGAGKARHPFVLFADTNHLLTWDVLPQAVQRLQQDSGIGAVRVRLDGQEQWPVSSSPWHGSIQAGQLSRSQGRAKGRPGSSRQAASRGRPGVFAFTAAFLLCRKEDFDRLGGFKAEELFFQGDFCGRLEEELGKKTWCSGDQPGLIRQGPDRVRLRFFPDYSRGNPYQRLLYNAFPDHFQIQPGSLEETLAAMHDDQEPEAHVFHLHWTNPVLRGAESLEQAKQMMEAFLHQLDLYLGLGGVLVWTVHNILPHKTQYPDLEQELCRALVSRAHVVHVHSLLVPELARTVYDIPLHKVVLAPHGNYIGVYPVTKNRERARELLGLPVKAPVFLFVGQIRAYKGLRGLQSAFSTCLEQYSEAHLLVAGRLRKEEHEDISGLFSGLQQCRFYPHFIPDEELGDYLQAADYMVLPYTQVLTSGSVVLAQSFGLPPIVPDLGLLREHVRDGVSGYLYDPEDPEGLTLAMLRALNNHQNRAGVSAGAFEAARSLPWQHSAAVLAARISSAMRGVVCPDELV